MKIYFLLLFVLLSTYVSAVNVDENVEKILKGNSETDVVIVFSERSRFLNNEFSANRIISNLDMDEFEGKYRRNSNIATGKLNKEGLEKLKANNNIDGIYLNYKFKANLNESTKLVNSSLLNTLRVKGTYNLTGKGIGVCLLDTGVDYNLPSLGGGLGKKVLTGYDFASEPDDNNPMDDNGHGTHLAGIIAGNGSVTGVAPEANIIAVKVLGQNGAGFLDDLLDGIQWCIDNSAAYNISIISMSLGCGVFDNYCDLETNCGAIGLRDKINDAVAKNISVISSTGNNGDGSQSSGDSFRISAPACLSNVTSVGALENNFSFASYGNRNNLTSFVAPGSGIVSLKNSEDCLCGSCGLEVMSCSGTSMASPHVAGIYALLLQYLRDENNSLMTNSQLKDVLTSTGLDVVDSSTNVSYKFINSYKALLYLDNFIPEVKIYYPENKTYKTGNIIFDFNSADVNLNSSWYSLDGSINISLIQNTTLDVGNGSHYLTLYANDTNGNLNSTSIRFFVNTSLPTLILNSPEENETDNDGVVDFNCSATSPIGLKNISLMHNISGVFRIDQTKEISGESSYAIFSINSPNIKFIWNCLVNDIDNAYAFGDNRSLTVKVNKKPNITSYLPSNLTQTVDEGQSLSFNQTSTDLDNDVLSYFWLLNDVEKSTTQNYTYNPSYTESGTYVLSLIASDGLINTSVNWSVTVNDVILCGNNIKETGESCDGSDLDGKSCSTQGFSSGSLSCSGSCTFVTSSCTNSANTDTTNPSSGSGGGNSLSEFSDTEFLEETQTSKAEATVQASQAPVSVTVEKPDVDKEEETINVIKGETINFVLDTQEHKVTLDEIKENEVDITINSKTARLNLKLNEEKEADIDDDKANDIKVRLDAILDGEAILKLTKLNSQENNFSGITGFFTYKEQITNYGAGALGLIFIFLFVLLMFKKKNRRG